MTASETLSLENQSGTSSVTEDDGKSSKSMQSSSFIHASQASDGAKAEQLPSSQSRKTKAHLWNEMKIDCELSFHKVTNLNCILTVHSYRKGIHSHICSCPFEPSYEDTTEPTWTPKLPLKRFGASCTTAGRSD